MTFQTRNPKQYVRVSWEDNDGNKGRGEFLPFVIAEKIANALVNENHETKRVFLESQDGSKQEVEWNPSRTK